MLATGLRHSLWLYKNAVSPRVYYLPSYPTLATMNIPGKAVNILDFQKPSLTLLKPPVKDGDKKSGNKFGSVGFVKYNGFPARFFLPVVRVPFGVRESDLDEKKPLDINFSFDQDVENADEVARALKALESLQERVVELAQQNKDWLYKDGAKVSLEEVAERVQSFLKYPDTYAPHMKARIETSLQNREEILSLKGRPLLVHEDKTEIPVTRTSIQQDVARGSRLKPIIEIAQMFVSNKGQATTIKWRMSHAKVISLGDSGADWEMDEFDASPATGKAPQAQETQRVNRYGSPVGSEAEDDAAPQDEEDDEAF